MINAKNKIAILAYTAGLFDGEGCVSIVKCSSSSKQGFHLALTVRISNTNEWLINWLKMQFGGATCKMQTRPKNTKDCWQWVKSGAQARDFLVLILPYLFIKKPNAEVAIHFQNTKLRRPTKKHPISSSEWILQEADFILNKKYNQRGKV